MHHQYANSPLIETVIEVRFRSDVGWDDATANATYELLSSEFSRQITGSARFVAEGYDANAILQFWREADEDGAVILSPNALSVTHLQPYPGWDQFKGLGMRVYDAYLQAAQPKGILHIGLRYNNQIRLPAVDRGVDLYSYFNIGIALRSKQLPEALESFKVEFRSRHRNNRDVLALTWRGDPESGLSPMIKLDLDYGLSRPETISMADVGTWLDEANGEVHTVFEGLIRNELRALFYKKEEHS